MHTYPSHGRKSKEKHISSKYLRLEPYTKPITQKLHASTKLLGTKVQTIIFNTKLPGILRTLRKWLNFFFRKGYVRHLCYFFKSKKFKEKHVKLVKMFCFNSKVLCSWDIQMLVFFNLRFHDVIKCPSMKQRIRFA